MKIGIATSLSNAKKGLNLYGPPYALPIIEGFQQVDDNVPTGGITWLRHVTEFEDGTITLSNQHVVYGASSALAETTPNSFEIYTGNLYGGEGQARGFDLTGYNTVTLSAYISLATGGDYLSLEMNDSVNWDGSFNGIGSSSPNQTGAVTLSVDISGVADKRNMVFGIINFNGANTLTAYLGKIYAS